MILSATSHTKIQPLFIALIPMLVLLVSLSTWAQDPAPNSNKRNITIGIKLDSPPWIYAQGEKQTGLLLDYADQTFEQLPYTHDYALYSSYPRLVQAINLGHIDAMFAVKDTKIALPTAPHVICTEAISGEMRYGFYALKERGIKPASSISELSNYRLAIGRATARQRFPDFHPQNITQHLAISDAYKMLISHRADIAVLSQVLTLHWQQQFGKPFIELLPLGSYTTHVCLSRQTLNNNESETLTQTIHNQPKILPFKSAVSP